MAKAKKEASKEPGAVTVTISPPNLKTAEFKCRGTAPYMQNRFSAKAMEMMAEKQKAGSTANKGRKKEAKDFEACYEGAKHISTAGWLGIPASAFRAAAISTCRLVGFKMTLAKLSLFVLHDGVDKVDGTPLVKITRGQPRAVELPARVANGVMDIRIRPLWDEWEFTLRVTYDADQFTLTDVTNLVTRAGMQVGVGEGRPDSRMSAGLGYGTFEVLG